MEVRKAPVSCQYIVETNIIINKAHVALSNLRKLSQFLLGFWSHGVVRDGHVFSTRRRTDLGRKQGLAYVHYIS